MGFFCLIKDEFCQRLYSPRRSSETITAFLVLFGMMILAFLFHYNGSFQIFSGEIGESYLLFNSVFLTDSVLLSHMSVLIPMSSVLAGISLIFWRYGRPSQLLGMRPAKRAEEEEAASVLRERARSGGSPHRSGAHGSKKSGSRQQKRCRRREKGRRSAAKSSSLGPTAVAAPSSGPPNKHKTAGEDLAPCSQDSTSPTTDQCDVQEGSTSPRYKRHGRHISRRSWDDCSETGPLKLEPIPLKYYRQHEHSRSPSTLSPCSSPTALLFPQQQLSPPSGSSFQVGRSPCLNPSVFPGDVIQRAPSPVLTRLFQESAECPRQSSQVVAPEVSLPKKAGSPHAPVEGTCPDPPAPPVVLFAHQPQKEDPQAPSQVVAASVTGGDRPVYQQPKANASRNAKVLPKPALDMASAVSKVAGTGNSQKRVSLQQPPVNKRSTHHRTQARTSGTRGVVSGGHAASSLPHQKPKRHEAHAQAHPQPHHQPGHEEVSSAWPSHGSQPVGSQRHEDWANTRRKRGGLMHGGRGKLAQQRTFNQRQQQQRQQQQPQQQHPASSKSGGGWEAQGSHSPNLRGTPQLLVVPDFQSSAPDPHIIPFSPNHSESFWEENPCPPRFAGRSVGHRQTPCESQGSPMMQPEAPNWIPPSPGQSSSLLPPDVPAFYIGAAAASVAGIAVPYRPSSTQTDAAHEMAPIYWVGEEINSSSVQSFQFQYSSESRPSYQASYAAGPPSSPRLMTFNTPAMTLPLGSSPRSSQAPPSYSGVTRGSVAPGSVETPASGEEYLLMREGVPLLAARALTKYCGGDLAQLGQLEGRDFDKLGISHGTAAGVRRLAATHSKMQREIWRQKLEQQHWQKQSSCATFPEHVQPRSPKAAASPLPKNHSPEIVLAASNYQHAQPEIVPQSPILRSEESLEKDMYDIAQRMSTSILDYDDSMH